MNYYLRQKGLYLTKSKEFVSAVELDSAWGFKEYVTASQTAMKEGGDFEVIPTLEIFMRYIRSNEPGIEVLKAGINEKREKIYEQAMELIQLNAANKALILKLKLGFNEKESS